MGGISLLHFKTDYIAIVIKTVSYWWRDKHIDQWNRTENAEINPYRYIELILDRD